MDRARLQWTATTLLDQPLNGQSASPEAIWFLLHACVEHGVVSAREQVELGLTCALDAVHDERDACRRIAWLELLMDASVVTDDQRLIDSVHESLAPAVDALESMVRGTYEPGEGLVGRSCADHLRCANALLTAFQLCGRLPYAMLAEELVQSARRRWWRHGRLASATGHDHRESLGFVIDETDSADDSFYVNCLGAAALSRVAALHVDPEYRSAAVLAPDAAYAADARSLLTTISEQAARHPAHAAIFGRALLTWFALEPNLQ